VIRDVFSQAEGFLLLRAVFEPNGKMWVRALLPVRRAQLDLFAGQLSRNLPSSVFSDVENIWKSCALRWLTGFSPHCMVVRFRGQSDSDMQVRLQRRVRLD
jgi:hypothetical protein